MLRPLIYEERELINKVWHEIDEVREEMREENCIYAKHAQNRKEQSIVVTWDNPLDEWLDFELWEWELEEDK